MKTALIKTIIYSAVAVALISCTGQLDVQQPSNGQMTVTAYVDEATKTALQQDGDGFDVVWSEGDKILIGGQEFTLVGEGGSREGEFTGPQLEDGEYDAYFATTDGSIPTTQNFIAGRIGNAPMSARLTVSGGKPRPISFKNIGGLLCIAIKNIQQAPVKSIAITGNLSNVTRRIFLDCGTDGVRLSEDGTEFFIAMPEGSYSTVSIEVSDGSQTITKTLDGLKRLEIVRSQITPASFSVLFSGKYPRYHKGHEYVDLKLPSKVLWATCNLGADKPYLGGGRYVWSQNQAAQAVASEWGGDWRLPTLAEVEELIANATIRQGRYLADDFDNLDSLEEPENPEPDAGSTRPYGQYFVNQGKYIFFPFLSYPPETYSFGGVGYYWTSNFDMSNDSKLPYVMVLVDYRQQGHTNYSIKTHSIFHFSIRPVLDVR